jgi:hypothetical protein
VKGELGNHSISLTTFGGERIIERPLNFSNVVHGQKENQMATLAQFFSLIVANNENQVIAWFKNLFYFFQILHY